MLRLKQQHVLGEVSQAQETEEIEFLEGGSKAVVDGVGRGQTAVFCDEEDCCSLCRGVDNLEIKARVET